MKQILIKNITFAIQNTPTGPPPQFPTQKQSELAPIEKNSEKQEIVEEKKVKKGRGRASSSSSGEK